MNSIHLIYHTVKEYKMFFGACGVIRGPGYSTFEISMSQEVKKAPFAALTFESSKNFISTYFQKLMWFYLLVTKDSLLGKA